jgi:type VI protein secretion system component Hcp
MLCFVKFDTFQGSCDHDKYVGWSTVYSFDFSVDYGFDSDHAKAKTKLLHEAAKTAHEEDSREVTKKLAGNSASSDSQKKQQKLKKQRKFDKNQARDFAHLLQKPLKQPEEKESPQSVFVRLSKTLDAVTVELLRRAWSRSELFKTVTLDVCGVGEKGLVPVVKIVMKGVSVQFCSVDAIASLESVNLQFQSIDFSYFPVDSQGKTPYSCTCRVGVTKLKSS